MLAQYPLRQGTPRPKRTIAAPASHGRDHRVSSGAEVRGRRREAVCYRVPDEAVRPTPVRKTVAIFSLLLCLGGCGTTQGSTPKTSPDEAAIRQTVGEFLDGFEKADAGRVCAVLTSTLRQTTTRKLWELEPSLRGKSCDQALVAFYRRAPLNRQPPAAEEAGNWNYRGIKVDGQRATVRFSDGRTWTLRKIGTRWLISDMPILPQ